MHRGIEPHEEYPDERQEQNEPSAVFDSEEIREDLFRTMSRDLLSEDDEKRYRALNLIQYFECDPRLGALMNALLQDPDARRMRDGIEAIGAWGHTDGSTMLIDFMTNTSKRDRLTDEVQLDILVSLGRIGGPESLEFLRHYTLERFNLHVPDEDALGMAGVEAVASLATRGNSEAIEFLLKGCEHASWNMREACADSLSLVFAGHESIPRRVYDVLVRLSQDADQNVRIAAYMSLDDIVGLDAENKKILEEARHRQVFGDHPT
jgi:hypothetical protein